VVVWHDRSLTGAREQQGYVCRNALAIRGKYAAAGKEGRHRMRIWKLVPTDAADPRWRQWNPTPMLVRATDAKEARRLAAAFADRRATAQSTARFGTVYVNPWGMHQDREVSWPTYCEDITDGPPEVLD
jgi:hypothetical protein